MIIIIISAIGACSPPHNKHGQKSTAPIQISLHDVGYGLQVYETVHGRVYKCKEHAFVTKS